MKVWVTRDKTTSSALSIWNKAEPVMSDSGYFDVNYNDKPAEWADEMYTFSSKEFKEAFSFTPRRGSCKQYELTLKEI